MKKRKETEGIYLLSGFLKINKKERKVNSVVLSCNCFFHAGGH